MCDCMCRCVFRCVLWPFCLTLAQSLNGTWVFSNLSGNRPASHNHAIFGCLTLVQCERLTVNQGVALTVGQSHPVLTTVLPTLLLSFLLKQSLRVFNNIHFNKNYCAVRHLICRHRAWGLSGSQWMWYDRVLFRLFNLMNSLFFLTVETESKLLTSVYSCPWTIKCQTF